MRTFLFGAGAAAEAGIPTAKPMARRAYEFRKGDATNKAFEVAIGGLQSHRSSAKGDPFGEIDVEDLYEVLRALGDRNASLIAPFVGSWSDALRLAESAQLEAAIDEVANSLGEELKNLVDERRGGQAFYGYEFRRTLYDALAISAGLSADVFSYAAREMLRIIGILSWIPKGDEAARVQYLRPLVASSNRKTALDSHVKL